MNILIVGAGYVGLPLAVAFSKTLKVDCYDIDKDRIQELKKGIDKNKQEGGNLINKNLNFINYLDIKNNYKFIIITVPTPINGHNHPDLSHIENATINIAQLIRKNTVIIYESTTYPGCTEEFCIPLLEQHSNLKYNKDFFVAYSPERVNPGDKINTLTKIIKITSGSTPEIADKIDELYKSIITAGTYKASSIKVAELQS